MASQNILRLHNSCYMQFVLLREVIVLNIVEVTDEKLHGKY